MEILVLVLGGILSWIFTNRVFKLLNNVRKELNEIYQKILFFHANGNIVYHKLVVQEKGDFHFDKRIEDKDGLYNKLKIKPEFLIYEDYKNIVETYKKAHRKQNILILSFFPFMILIGFLLTRTIGMNSIF